MAVDSPNRGNGNGHAARRPPSPTKAQPESSVPSSDMMVKEVQEQIHAFCRTSLAGGRIAAEELKWDARKEAMGSLDATAQAAEKQQIKQCTMQLRKDKKIWQDNLKQELLAVISTSVQAILPEYVQGAIEEYDKQQGQLNQASVNKLLDERDALWEAKFRAMRSEMKDELQAESSKVHEVLTTVVQRTAPSSPILSRDPRSSFRGPNASLSDEQLNEKIVQGVATETAPLRTRLDQALQSLDDMRGRVNMIKGNVLPGMSDKLAKHNDLLKSHEKQMDDMGLKIAAQASQLGSTEALYNSIKEIQEGLEKQGSLSVRVQALEENVTARLADTDKLELAIENASKTEAKVDSVTRANQQVEERLAKTPTTQDTAILTASVSTLRTANQRIEERLSKAATAQDLATLNASLTTLRDRQNTSSSEIQAIRTDLRDNFHENILAAHEAITYLHQSVAQVQSTDWFDQQLRSTVRTFPAEFSTSAIQERLTKFEIATGDTIMRILNWLTYLQTAAPGA